MRRTGAAAETGIRRCQPEPGCRAAGRTKDTCSSLTGRSPALRTCRRRSRAPDWDTPETAGTAVRPLRRCHSARSAARARRTCKSLRAWSTAGNRPAAPCSESIRMPAMLRDDSGCRPPDWWRRSSMYRTRAPPRWFPAWAAPAARWWSNRRSGSDRCSARTPASARSDRTSAAWRRPEIRSAGRDWRDTRPVRRPTVRSVERRWSAALRPARCRPARHRSEIRRSDKDSARRTLPNSIGSSRCNTRPARRCPWGWTNRQCPTAVERR